MACVACVPAIFSCSVDKNYDGLFVGDAEIDQTIQILPGLEIPIGSLQKITLGDFINIEGEDGFVQVKDGVYWFSLDGVSMDYNFSMPSMNFNVPEAEQTMEFSSSLSFASSSVATAASTGESLRVPISGGMTFSFNEDFPSEVQDIKSVSTVGTNVKISLSYAADGVPFNAVYLEEGTKVTLPEGYVLSNSLTPGVEILDNKRSFRLSSEVKLVSGSEFDVVCSLDGINIPDSQSPIVHTASGSKISFSGEIAIEGGMKCYKSDLNLSDPSISSFNVKLKLRYGAGSVNVASAVVKLDVTPEIAAQEVEIGNLPDFLTGDNVVVDMDDIYAFLTVRNDFPLGFGFGASLETFASGATSPAHSYVLSNLKYDSGETRTTVLCEKGYSGTDAVEYKLDGFGDLLNPMPSKIRVDNIRVTADNNWTTITSGTEYGIGVSMGIDTPIKFGKNSRLTFGQELGGAELGLGENVVIQDATLSFKVENTLPMTLGIDAEFLNKNGEPMSGVSIKLLKESPYVECVSGGTEASPSTGEIAFHIHSDSSDFSFDSIKLNLNASISEECAGIPLSPQQGLTLKDIKFKLDNGIVINTNNKDEQ